MKFKFIKKKEERKTKNNDILFNIILILKKNLENFIDFSESNSYISSKNVHIDINKVLKN